MLLFLLACVHAPPDDETPSWEPPVITPRATLPPGLSDRVVEVMLTYPRDGSYGFYWPPDDGVWWGTTREIWYQGALVSTADPERRSHCVGLTWEVAMTVLQAAAGEGPINGMTLEHLATFRGDWFVRELQGVGASEALERYGVGTRVPLEEARRGDFVQMWTVGAAGHSAIFDRWDIKDGRVVGMRYWSTHPALNGVGYWVDPFTPWGLDPERIYVGRIVPPDEWRRGGVGAATSRWREDGRQARAGRGPRDVQQDCYTTALLYNGRVMFPSCAAHPRSRNRRTVSSPTPEARSSRSR